MQVMIGRVWQFCKIVLISLHSVHGGRKVVEGVEESSQETTVAKPQQNALKLTVINSDLTDADSLLSLKTEFFS